MKKMVLAIAVLVGMTGFYGCAVSQQTPANKSPNAEESVKEAYSKIKLDDGIDKKEASILADVYFNVYISGCGGTSGDPIDQGNKWEIKTLFGYAAQPYDPIFIDKATGTIACAKGPTIKAPGNVVK
jgi:hypothetical protein